MELLDWFHIHFTSGWIQFWASDSANFSVLSHSTCAEWGLSEGCPFIVNIKKDGWRPELTSKVGNCSARVGEGASGSVFIMSWGADLEVGVILAWWQLVRQLAENSCWNRPGRLLWRAEFKTELLYGTGQADLSLGIKLGLAFRHTKSWESEPWVHRRVLAYFLSPGMTEEKLPPQGGDSTWPPSSQRDALIGI